MSESNSGNVSGGGPAPARQLLDYFYLVLERFWLVLIAVVLGLVYAQHKVSNAPRLYRATATIEVLRQNKAAGELDSAQQFRGWNIREQINTTVEKLGMLSLYESVAADGGYQHLLRLGDGAEPAQIEAAQKRLPFEMRGMISAKQRLNTQLIDLSAVHTDPNFAKDGLVAALEKYADLNFTARAETSSNNISFLVDQLDQMRKGLADAQKSIVVYDEALRIRDDIRKAESEILEMEKKYLPKWPPLVQSKTRLKILQDNFGAEVERIQQTSETESQYWSDQVDLLNDTPEGDRANFQIRAVETRHATLVRDFEPQSQLYESLLERAKRSGVESEFNQDEFSIVQPPYAGETPFSPQPQKEFIRYGGMGMAFGLLLAFFLGCLDGTVRRIEDVEHISRIPVLATIQKSRRLKLKRKGGGKQNALLVGQGESGKIAESFQLAEAFQSLRASLTPKGDEAPRKTLIITSALPEEGKSIVSVNTAAAFATGGQKTVLVDLDFRKPRVQRYLGLEANKLGVSDILNGDSDLDSAIQSTQLPNLQVLTGGKAGFDPSMVSGDELPQLLSKLQERFDRVILDTAPVLAVSDTNLIADHADGICLVFRMWKTPRRALVRALKQLANGDSYPIGIIANFMPKKRGFGQYGYYYSYSSGSYYYQKAYGKS